MEIFTVIMIAVAFGFILIGLFSSDEKEEVKDPPEPGDEGFEFQTTTDLFNYVAFPIKVIAKSSSFPYASTVIDAEGEFLTISAADFNATYTVGEVINEPLPEALTKSQKTEL